MGQCSSKQDIRSVAPEPEASPSEIYIQNSPNLTRRRIKRTRSKIIIDGLIGNNLKNK